MNTRVQCVCVYVCGGVYAHAHAGYHQTLAHSKNSIDVISIDIYLVKKYAGVCVLVQYDMDSRDLAKWTNWWGEKNR